VSLTSRDKHTKLPPRWVIRTVWAAHRGLLRATGNRMGLKAPTADRHCGLMRLRTTGRRSGAERAVVLNYLQDGDRLVTLAMNGWHPADPAWLLNLRARPAAVVDLLGAHREATTCEVTGHEATGEERDRLWALLHDYLGYGDLEAFTVHRGRESPIVVLTPRQSSIGQSRG
jgi:deazaflavin-dependent oxidoreductase (nitroreductase family)